MRHVMTTGRRNAAIERRARARRRQSGFGMMEALIGLVMISLLITAGFTGLRTLNSTSSAANQTARLDALLVGAGEAVQQTKYFDCAQPNNYQSAIQNWESQRVANQRLVQQGGTAAPQFNILTVDAGGPDCTTSLAGDPGRQEVTLSATLDGQTRKATVRKIDPKKRLRLPKAVIDKPITVQSVGGSIEMRYSFTAADSTGDEGLILYTWDCGPDAKPLTDPRALPGDLDPSKKTKLPLASPRDAMFCAYESTPTAITPVRVYLTVEDRLGQTDSTSEPIDVPQRTDPSKPPIAVATATSPVSGGGPFTVTGPITMTFSSAGSQPVDGQLNSWVWNFGDPNSGAGNVVSGQTATHQFSAAGPYEVTLTVGSDSGLSASDSVTVNVVVPGVPLPVARFAAPGTFYNPARVPFDATASTPASGANRIVSYRWDFGDGTTGSGATPPPHDYGGTSASPNRSYLVTLTVEDEAGRTNSTSRQVQTRRMDPPLDLQSIGAQNTIPCLFFFCPGERPGYMDFGWNRVTPGPGDAISMDINIIRATGGGNPCWVNPPGRTRSVAQTGTSGYQTYRWTQITWSPISPVDFSNMFCAGSNYEYQYRVKRVASNGTFYGPWSPTKSQGF